MRRLLACLTAFAFYAATTFAPALESRAFASQNSLQSPTTGTVSGLQLTNNYNNALDSVNTMNSGAAAPTNQLSGSPSAFNRWCNTTSNPYPCNVYDGSQWLAPYYVDATNHILDMQIGGGTATVASASTTDLCSVPQNALTISGTTTVTSFGSTCSPGVMKTVTFSGILTLTYNSTSLIIPGAASLNTAAGDSAWLQALGSGNWRVINYSPASGQAVINPAVPIGAMLNFTGYAIPTNFVEGYGQAISRSSYPNYLSAVTSVQSVTATSGSPTLTGFSDTTRFGYGQKVEAAFLPTGAQIKSCTSTTCTLSANATSSTTGNVTVFLYGDGDGSTTVNLPDCRARSIAFRDNIGGTPASRQQVTTASITTTSGSAAATVSSGSGITAQMYVISANVPPGTQVSAINGATITLSQNATASASGTAARFSATLDAQMLGSTGGSVEHLQAQLELPNVNFTVSATGSGSGSGSLTSFRGQSAPTGYGNGSAALTNQVTNADSNEFGGNVSVSVTTTDTGTAASGGANAPMLQQNPTLVLTCIVRVSRLISHDLPALASNDNAPIIADRPRRAA